jgi:hypothetical protein
MFMSGRGTLVAFHHWRRRVHFNSRYGSPLVFLKEKKYMRACTNMVRIGVAFPSFVFAAEHGQRGDVEDVTRGVLPSC